MRDGNGAFQQRPGLARRLWLQFLGLQGFGVLQSYSKGFVSAWRSSRAWRFPNADLWFRPWPSFYAFVETIFNPSFLEHVWKKTTRSMTDLKKFSTVPGLGFSNFDLGLGLLELRD